jgi:bacterial leucyl aminopeptidase
MAVRVVFFDLGGILGDPVLSPPPIKVLGFHPYSFAKETLQRLTNQGIRLGVISNTGTEAGSRMSEVLDEVGLLEDFDPALLIFSADVGMTKETPEIFRLAVRRANVSPNECLYVGEDPQERTTAAQAGLLTCRHATLVGAEIEKQNP